jgi:predicted transcriptional regulator
MRDLHQESAHFFANQLRAARLAALADAEAFNEIIHVVERLGSYLYGRIANLGEYKDALSGLAVKSGLAEPRDEFRKLLTPYAELYESVKDARNDALHQGAFARHLTRHAIELAIILEDALSTYLKPIVSDFMVRDPVCAELWQPVSFIRQQMLANSYSYMPVLGDDKIWRTVSDVSIARFLGLDRDGTNRKSRLATTLQDALKIVSDLLEDAIELSPGATRSEALDELKSKKTNVLLVRDSREVAILGILTAFDLL